MKLFINCDFQVFVVFFQQQKKYSQVWFTACRLAICKKNRWPMFSSDILRFPFLKPRFFSFYLILYLLDCNADPRAWYVEYPKAGRFTGGWLEFSDLFSDLVSLFLMILFTVFESIWVLCNSWRSIKENWWTFFLKVLAYNWRSCLVREYFYLEVCKFNFKLPPVKTTWIFFFFCRVCYVIVLINVFWHYVIYSTLSNRGFELSFHIFGNMFEFLWHHTRSSLLYRILGVLEFVSW